MEHNPIGSFTLGMYLPINGKNINLCNLYIIESFYSLWSIGHPWRASMHCDLRLSLWPHHMIFLWFLFHPILSFATFSLADLFFYIPEDSNLIWFCLSLPLLCVMCGQSNSIFFFLSEFLFASVFWFSIILRLLYFRSILYSLFVLSIYL